MASADCLLMAAVRSKPKSSPPALRASTTPKERKVSASPEFEQGSDLCVVLKGSAGVPQRVNDGKTAEKENLRLVEAAYLRYGRGAEENAKRRNPADPVVFSS